MEQSDRLPRGVWKIALVAVISVFLAQLDATVVNVSLSSLAVELHTSLSVIQWVTSGYLLALALMLPLNGWLLERIGAKRLYIFCFAWFTVASVLCSLAWSAGSLIGFRVLQGVSGGLMAPMAQFMIARAAGKHLVRVMGYAAVVVLLGPMLGPVLAGAILQHASWRWLFLINLPIGILAITLALLFLPDEDGIAESPRSFDLTGFLLVSPGLVLFLFGAERLRDRAGWAALAASAVLIAVFYRRAARDGAKALIDVQLFRGRVFSASAVVQFTVNGLAIAGQMLIPVFLIRAAGQSPSTTGWLMAPMGLGMMITYPSLGRLTQRFGIRGTSLRGAVISLVGTLAFLYMSCYQLNVPLLMIALFVRGVGMSGVGIPSVSAAYASVPKEKLPAATTALNIAQRLGGPTLTTICATFLVWRLAAAHTPVQVNSAFTLSFALLCALHLFQVLAALRLPALVEKRVESPTAGAVPEMEPIAD